MDARECYVLREEPCKECGGGCLAMGVFGTTPCSCFDDHGKVQVRIPLIDALRALGIDVAEPEADVAGNPAAADALREVALGMGILP